MKYKISHPTKSINCKIDLPSSKSISNRLLIIQYLCKDHFEIKNISNSDDTIGLKNALNSNDNRINIGPAGTSFRFLTACFATIKNKEVVLTGSKRIQERPIKSLVTALNNIGANISYDQREGFAPLKITGKEMLGGSAIISGNISSQFISALLLIAPVLKNGLKLTITDKIASKSYIEMTLNLMSDFGIIYNWEKNVITIKPQNYIAKDYSVEPDWSAASFWFEIAALSKNCNIELANLNKSSIQGDKEIMTIFSNLYVSTFIQNNSLVLKKNKVLRPPNNINLLNTPDLYQPIKCTLCALNINSIISGTTTLNNKETKRIEATENELKKVCTTKNIKTYDDHRMVMSFAPLCLIYGEIIINNPKLVSKSYPNFWKDLEKAGFIVDS